MSLFTWGFKKYYLAHLNIQIFLVPILFFFLLRGKKEEKNRSDVISFSCTPISKETRAGRIVAYKCARLNLEPLQLFDVFYFFSLNSCLVTWLPMEVNLTTILEYSVLTL